MRKIKGKAEGRKIKKRYKIHARSSVCQRRTKKYAK